MKRTAPVQGSTPILWDVHLLAWEAYDKKWNFGKSAELVAESGGFRVNELDELLPDWRERDGRMTDTTTEPTRCRYCNMKVTMHTHDCPYGDGQLVRRDWMERHMEEEVRRHRAAARVLFCGQRRRVWR